MNLPDLKHELDDIVADEEKQRGFRINDDGAASWAMRKLAEINDQLLSNEQIHKQETERLNLWLTEVNKPLESKTLFFKSILEDYARRERNEKDRKTISLPHGKVSTRPASDKWETDTATLLAFLKTNELTDLIKVKEEPSMTAVKNAFTVTPDGQVLTAEGEIVPGVKIIQTDISVSINTSTKEEAE